MKLYYAPGTCSLAAWIALEWAGADYETQQVQLGTDEIRQINPLGAVPALDAGDGKIKTQLIAILNYIVRKYPEADLGPDEGIEDKFLYDEAAAFLSSDMHPAFKPIFGPAGYTTDSDEDAYDQVKEAAFTAVDGVMTHLDSMLEETGHVYKDKKTVLDAVAYIFAGWAALTPKSWDQYPNIEKFMKMMEEDQAVQKVMQAANK